MKITNIFKSLFAMILLLQMSACNPDTDAEKIFDETPTTRLNERKTELNEALLSSEFGWKAVYFTDNTVLGGYTHIFKFAKDGSVVMASDFDADTKKYSSQYEIQLGSTVSLVFTTANRIHLLSESDNYPIPALRSKGYLGDFQFLYYGEENGELIFKTNRNGQEVRFVKATAQDFDDLPKNLDMIPNVIGSNTRPLFRLLETNDGTKKHQFDFSFSPVTRFAEANSLETGYSVNYEMGIGYTPTGIVINPAIEVGGQKLTNFIYNNVDGSFTSTGTNGVSAVIKYTNTPLVLTNDYIGLLPGKVYSRYGYFADDTTKDATTNSPLFKAELAKINAALPAGIKIATVQIYLNHTAGNFIYYTFSGSTATIQHFITVEEDAVGKKVTFKSGAWTTGTAPAYLRDFDKYLVDAGGIYVKKEPFKLGYVNDIYTFTGAASLFRMTTYKLN